jgi:hypothetical protein
MWAYINYPNPHFTIHRDPNCPMIQMHHAVDQRKYEVKMENLGNFLLKFIDNEIDFAAHRGMNDIWIKVELDMPEQENAIIYVIRNLAATVRDF